MYIKIRRNSRETSDIYSCQIIDGNNIKDLYNIERRKKPMRTNEHTRKTMTPEWIEFFNSATKKKIKKYFEDGGYRCCAYSPEHDGRKVVQVALRRCRGRAQQDFKENDQRYLEEVLGKRGAIVEILYVTNSPLHGGVYICDLIDLWKSTLMLYLLRNLQ